MSEPTQEPDVGEEVTTRSTRRPQAVFHVDGEVGLRVLKPKKKGGPARYSHPHPLTGERVQGRFHGTSDGIRRQAMALAADLRTGHDSDWRETTFEEVTTRYLADPAHRWSARTRRNQEQRIDVLVSDTKIGALTLGQIVASPKAASDELQRLALKPRGKTGRPYAASTLRLYHGTLGTVLSWAQGAELMPYELSPMKRIGIPLPAAGAKTPAMTEADDDEYGSVPSGEIPAMTDALRLAHVWVERAAGSPWWRGLAVELAATSGLRWGELHALRVSDMILGGEDPRVRVRRQVEQDKNGKPTGGWVPPKNKSKRAALLPPHLEAALRRRAEECAGRSALLFPSPRDATRVYLYKSFRESAATFAEAAGWPIDDHGLLRWTFHSLRHSGLLHFLGPGRSRLSVVMSA